MNCPHSQAGACTFCYEAARAEVERLTKADAVKEQFCREFIWGEDNPGEYQTLHDKSIASQKAVEQLTKAVESYKNAFQDSQDKACLGHIEQVARLEEENRRLLGTKCSCTDPEIEPHGIVCTFCAYKKTLLAFNQITKVCEQMREALDSLKHCLADKDISEPRRSIEIRLAEQALALTADRVTK